MPATDGSSNIPTRLGFTYLSLAFIVVATIGLVCLGLKRWRRGGTRSLFWNAHYARTSRPRRVGMVESVPKSNMELGSQRRPPLYEVWVVPLSQVGKEAAEQESVAKLENTDTLLPLSARLITRHSISSSTYSRVNTSSTSSLPLDNSHTHAPACVGGVGLFRVANLLTSESKEDNTHLSSSFTSASVDHDSMLDRPSCSGIEDGPPPGDLYHQQHHHHQIEVAMLISMPSPPRVVPPSSSSSSASPRTPPDPVPAGVAGLSEINLGVGLRSIRRTNA